MTDGKRNEKSLINHEETDLPISVFIRGNQLTMSRTEREQTQPIHRQE